jgi:hypothetical protein
LDSEYSKSQFRLKSRRKVAFGPVCRWQHYTHAGSAPAGKIETQGLKRCEQARNGLLRARLLLLKMVSLI